MKTVIIILLFCCLTVAARAGTASFGKLVAVNKCWLKQRDAPANIPQPLTELSEREWIRYHLQLVEQVLRSRSTSGLSAEQAARRMKSLDDLGRYWHEGNFPINTHSRLRTPIFIDAADNFCAVGYLLKASGNEAISRRIAAATNLAYVREMQYPELNAWAVANGFTVDELAWIQPGYPPAYGTRHVGKGTNGRVRSFYVDDTAGKLYVGGDFTVVDSAIPAPYIATITEANNAFSWQRVGIGGPGGPVYAIAQYGGWLFTAGVGGAYHWDGTTWAPAGQITGTMYALQELNSTLYAVGNFRDLSGNTGNFAAWTAGGWQFITGLNGTVRTVHEYEGGLVLGGRFSYQGTAWNAIRWEVNNAFVPFSNALLNEVRDFELFNDTLYAACRKSSTDSAKLLMRLIGNTWDQHRSGNALSGLLYSRPDLAINTLCADSDRLLIGGAFQYNPGLGTYAFNNLSLYSFGGNLYPDGGGWITVDSDVNAIIRFKDNIIYGGSFSSEAGNGATQSARNRGLNNITARLMTRTSVAGSPVPSSFQVAPNPVRSRGALQLTTEGLPASFHVTDMSGRSVLRGALPVQSKPEITLPALNPGTYFLQLEFNDGTRAAKPFSVH